VAGLGDIDGTTETTLLLAVEIQVYDQDADSTATLYWSEADVTTDAIDGTVRTWEGRIDGFDTFHRDQQIGGGRYAHPTCTFSVRLGMPEGDETDGLWDYLTDDHVWEDQLATAYLVDLSQTGGAGAREELKNAKVRALPSKLQPGGFFSLALVGGLWREKVPERRIAQHSDWRAPFVNPCLWTTNTAFLSANVTAAATTWAIDTVTQIKAGMALFCYTAATGAEIVRVDSVDGGAKTCDVTRGYNSTTPVAHSINDYVYAMIPGPAKDTTAQDGSQSGVCLPIVMGEAGTDRGIFDVTSGAAGRSHRVAGGAGATVELWVAAGAGCKVEEYWVDSAGTITATAAPSTYNDHDDVNGTVVAWGADPGGAGVDDAHLEPHPVEVGTYVDLGVNPHVFTANGDQVWARIRGQTRNNAEAGTRLQSTADLAKWLIADTDWGLGLTLGDHVDTATIDGWLSGDWHDQYAESWWTETACNCPKYGSTDTPYVMDLLQEAADQDCADWFIRSGLLYPTRRVVAGSSDLTIKRHHCARGWPARLIDPQDIYCNILTARWGQSLLSEPIVNPTNDAPVEIPHATTIGDDDEIAARGEVSETITRQWVRKNLDADWVQQDDPTTSIEPLDAFAAAHQEQLAMRAQPQIWIEADLVENCAWLQQGDTIDFDITGVTDRLGQVRQVRKKRAQSGDGPLPPVVTTVRSWHINFPT